MTMDRLRENHGYSTRFQTFVCLDSDSVMIVNSFSGRGSKCLEQSKEAIVCRLIVVLKPLSIWSARSYHKEIRANCSLLC